MTVIVSFALGALIGAVLGYAFYRKAQSELARLKEALRAKVDSAL